MQVQAILIEKDMLAEVAACRAQAVGHVVQTNERVRAKSHFLICSDAFAGGWVAARIARHRMAAALIIGVLVLAGVIANNAMIPHPLWMTVAGIVLPLPLAWLAARAASPHVTR